jgi:demethylmenaquinone methyltransferase/2-methoxy-6-polyprenyl-1,4-benzoquinol methylase
MNALDETTRRNLELTALLREPVLRAALDALALPRGGHGLDVGTGIGLHGPLLAEATDGRVTGLDLAPALIECARERVTGSPWADRVAFVTGDARALPFNDGACAWAWSVDCVGYPAGEPGPALAEMARVVQPGGTVAVLGWTSQTLLAGYKQLEARLEAAASAYAPLLEGQPPAQHFLRARGAFDRVGLVDVTARTFVGEVRAPLGASSRAAVASLLGMLWDVRKVTVADDRAELARLTDPRSRDFLPDAPDYYGFFTYTMFAGRVRG